MQAVDILILSNGPGEVLTWVRPVVKALRQQLGDDRPRVRISVVLSPCPHASGREAAIARSYPEVDRVLEADGFWSFLLWGKTAENWDWRETGAIVFLGGDGIFPVILGHRLGYRSIVYAEWEARWHRWIDRFGVMNSTVMAGVSPQYARKFTVVGDLMAEVLGSQESLESQKSTVKRQKSLDSQRLKFNRENYLEGQKGEGEAGIELIGILPGSKSMKLSQGVPLGLAIAEYIYTQRPQTRFVIPVAPTLDIKTLARFANPQDNPVIENLGWTAASLRMGQEELTIDHESTSVFLETSSGLKVYLWDKNPAYNLLSQCTLCLTTVGANTAELGSLAVPMIVMIPTQQLDAMRAWDGLPGLLVNLPLVGSSFAKLINWGVWQWLTRKPGSSLLAWPNIWAKEAIVPELIGHLEPKEVAELALDYLSHPEKLETMRHRLRQVRGEPGAAKKLVQLVCEELAEGLP